MSDYFNVNQYCKDMTVAANDNDVVEFKRLNEATQIIYDDAYLARAYFWGVASSMENQLSYLGGNYLPNLERRMNTLNSEGILSQTDLDVNWHSNEDQLHVNDDQPVEEHKAIQQSRIDIVHTKMRTAAICYVLAVRAHDDISHTLDQLTFSGIKAKAEAKRSAALQATGT